MSSETANRPGVKARLAYANIFADDIDAMAAFYSKLLGFPVLEGHASPIYRCLDAGGGLEFGFNAPLAYDLLGVADRKPADKRSISAYFTFEVGSAAEVDELAAMVPSLGGRVVKQPYDTYYNARQVVLEDPEGNVFRINHRKGPRLAAEAVGNPPWAAAKPAVA